MSELNIHDFTGLVCPHPLLQTKKLLRQVEVGEEVGVLVTDPNALKDISMFCEKTGHRLVGSEDKGEGKTLIILQKMDLSK